MYQSWARWLAGGIGLGSREEGMLERLFSLLRLEEARIAKISSLYLLRVSTSSLRKLRFYPQKKVTKNNNLVIKMT